jgi:hypothetical protein
VQQLSDSDREELFCLFVTHCAINLKVKYSTIKGYLAAIKFHFIQGYPSLDPYGHTRCAKLACTLKGIKRSCSAPKPKRLPITLSMLNDFMQLLNVGVFNHYVDRMLKATFLLAFFAFLRCGEFTSTTTTFDPEVGLARQDVQMGSNDSGPVLYLHLRTSKTDPFREGVTLQVYPSHGVLCPVSAMQAFLRIRDSRFPLGPSPLFMLPEHIPLSRGQFITYLDTLLRMLRLPLHMIRPHSFRIGAATAAAAAHVPDHLLQTLGRWKSDCYQRYIHTPPNLIAQAQNAMASV